MVYKRTLAIVPDSCTLIHASLEAPRDDVYPHAIEDAKKLLDFARSYEIGVTTEKIIESTGKTKAAWDLTEREKANLSRNMSTLIRVNFPTYEIEKNLPLINSIYENAKKAFEEKVNRLIEGKLTRFRSRRRGIISNKKMKKAAVSINRVLEDPACVLMRKKLYDDPPDENDLYLLSLGLNLKSEFEHVLIATEDTHMCPVYSRPEIGFVISDEIGSALDIRCYQPAFLIRKALNTMRIAGMLREEDKVKSGEEE